ncbi:MAG: sugar ABC transporter substrate-binding protein [Anaerolinea sp.]|nr:sugar ABC transporter substrate-binding protein [Anaerolinea sp.]
MSKKQVFSLFSTILLVLVLLSACATPATQAPAAEAPVAAPAEAVTLNILVEGGGHSLQQAIADKFTAETGIVVNFVEVPYQEVYDKLAAEMAAGGSAYDVATVDVIWLPTFAPFATPLDDLYTDEVKADIFPSLVADAQSNGTFIGMPTWANAEVLYYQKSLFEDPAEQEAFKVKYNYDLKVPTTWQEFVDVAEFFTRDLDGDGTIDMYGADVKTKNPEEWEAAVLQAGSNGVVYDAEGNLIIDNQAHVDALQWYSDLHCKYNVTPPNVNEIDWGVSQQLFYDGKLAMEQFWGHNYRSIPSDAKVAGNVGVAPMIAGAGGAGAIPGPWFNIIPATGKNVEAAKQYVQFAYENNVLGIEAPLALAARISAYQSYMDKPGFEHFAALIDTLNAPKTMGRPMVTNWNEITNEVLTPMLQQAFTCDGTPVIELLANAKAQIEALP